jgi:hypothetical protein
MKLTVELAAPQSWVHLESNRGVLVGHLPMEVSRDFTVHEGKGYRTPSILLDNCKWRHRNSMLTFCGTQKKYQKVERAL